MSLADKKEQKTYENSEFDLDGSVLGEFLKNRLENKRDAKILITSKSASTGLGKSTLAILLCKWVHNTYHEDAWDATEYGYIDVNDYINKYLNTRKKTALLLDEIEAGADNRRAMSGENVNLSKAWSVLRMRNVITIATLPSTMMLDSRLKTLADVWINVVNRGFALQYFIWINDFSQEVRHIKFRHPKTGDQEILRWNAIDDDEDFQYMSELKNTDVFGKHEKTYEYSDIQSAKEKAKREKRNELVKTLYDKTQLSQSKVGKLMDMTQQQVSQIIRTK